MLQPTFRVYMPMAEKDYARLAKTPTQFAELEAAVQKMWDHEPSFTTAELGSIRLPTAIVDGDHEEAIKRSHTEELARRIPGSQLVLLPNLGHFGQLEDPAAFDAAVLRFLAAAPAW